MSDELVPRDREEDKGESASDPIDLVPIDGNTYALPSATHPKEGPEEPGGVDAQPDAEIDSDWATSQTQYPLAIRSINNGRVIPIPNAAQRPVVGPNWVMGGQPVTITPKPDEEKLEAEYKAEEAILAEVEEKKRKLREAVRSAADRKARFENEQRERQAQEAQAAPVAAEPPAPPAPEAPPAEELDPIAQLRDDLARERANLAREQAERAADQRRAQDELEAERAARVQNRAVSDAKTAREMSLRGCLNKIGATILGLTVVGIAAMNMREGKVPNVYPPVVPIASDAGTNFIGPDLKEKLGVPPQSEVVELTNLPPWYDGVEPQIIDGVHTGKLEIKVVNGKPIETQDVIRVEVGDYTLEFYPYIIDGRNYMVRIVYPTATSNATTKPIEPEVDLLWVK